MVLVLDGVKSSRSISVLTTDASVLGRQTVCLRPHVSRAPLDGPRSGGMSQAGAFIRPRLAHPLHHCSMPTAAVETTLLAHAQMILLAQARTPRQHQGAGRRAWPRAHPRAGCAGRWRIGCEPLAG